MDVPDIMLLDVKHFSSLEVVTTCKLLEHGPIVLRIVTCDVSNLYVKNLSVHTHNTASNAYLGNNVEAIAYLVQCLPESCPVVSSVGLSESE